MLRIVMSVLFAPSLALAEAAGISQSALKSDNEKICGFYDQDCEVELLQKNIRRKAAAVREPHLSGIEWSLEHLEGLHDASITPSDYMKKWCPLEKQIEQTPSMTLSDYKAISDQFKSVLDGVNTECAGEVCPAADVAGCWVRMAGHDFMDWVHITGEGGADGCVTFDDPDNGGLKECLAEGDNGVSIGMVYKDWCEKVSLADIIVIAAEASMEWTRDQHIAYYASESPSLPGADYKNSKPIDFSSTFKFGRKTKFNAKDGKGEKCVGRMRQLPDPKDHHCHAVERTFIGYAQLTPRETVAISAVHTLGRADAQFSGFEGTWSQDMKDAMFFNNRYFVLMLSDGWMVDKEMKAKGKIQWEVSSTEKPFSSAKQMMLSSDLCLLYGVGTAETLGHEPPYVPLSDEHENVCAWGDIPAGEMDGRDIFGKYYDNMLCGRPESEVTGMKKGALKKACCNGQKDVLDASHPGDIHGGLSAGDVLDFANDDNKLMDEFILVWNKLTEKGASLTALSS